MFYPDLNEIKQLANAYTVIPVSMEVNADMETPVTLFKRFEDSKYCFLLESVEGGEKWSRYSFIGKNPFLIVKSIGDKTLIEDKYGKQEEIQGNPLNILRSLMNDYKAPDITGLPRFNGGAVGYFGYDMARHSEFLPNVPQDDLQLPDSYFIFTDEVLAYDHLKQKIHIIVNMHVGTNVERDYSSTVERIKEIRRELSILKWKVTENKHSGSKSKENFKYKSNMTREDFCKNVVKAKKYINDGEIFQVVLSQRLCVETHKEPFDIYRSLRITNPSPYMYYLKFNDCKIIGSSPEMLTRVENGKVETCPIAGTRRRGLTIEEDERIEKDLLRDEKEIAEHMMLVDLGRNDIGKISQFGTIEINNLMHTEKFSHVMHLVTNISGRLQDNLTSFDAIMSIMPAGTLSGAPKIRAMQIIDELETVKRGVYGGGIGYLSFNGKLDSCITIRTIVLNENMAYIQAGAGIVADSIPDNEYQETLNKAEALLKALQEEGDFV